MVNLQSVNPSTAKLELFDIHGRKVLYKKIVLQAGHTTFSVEHLEKFSRGVYNLKITTGDTIYNKKILLQ